MAAEPFQAFISYSRAASQPLAVDLQHGLERFAKPWYRLRGMRVFRDDSSMSANTALWSTIETGLRQAEWFLLLATPASAASEWVAQEIDWWLRNKGPQRLLIVLSGGELYWDRVQRCFHPASTAIPPILRNAYPEEPRWIDVRWYGASTGGAGSSGAGVLPARSDPRFAERVADLAAAVRGVERDTLVGENVRQHQRALRLARGGVAVLALLLVLSIVAGVVAVAQRGVAVEQRNAAERAARISQARQLAATARALSATDIGKARLLAVRAYRLAPEPQTQSALLDTMTASPQLVHDLDAGGRVVATAATTDGSTAFASTADGQVLRWDLRTGTRSELGRLDGLAGELQLSADGRVLATRSNTEVAVWLDGRRTTLPTLPKEPAALTVSPSGDTVVVVYGDQTRAYVLRRAGGAYRLAPTRIAFSTGAFQLALPDDTTVSGWLFDAAEGHVEHRSVSSGRLVAEGRAGGGGSAKLGGALSRDGRHVAVLAYDNTGTFPIYRTDRDASADDGPGPGDLIGFAGGTVDPQVALSPDARLAAYAENAVIHVAATQRPGPEPFRVRELRGLARTGVNTLTFAGQRYLLSGSQDRLLVWDLDQNTALTSDVGANVPGVPTAALGPRLVPNQTGSRAVLVADAGFTVFDTTTGDAVSGSETSAFLDWRSDDQLFYADSTDRRVHLFDLEARRELSSWGLDWPMRSGSTALDIWSARYVTADDRLLIAGTRQAADFRAADGTPGARRSDLSYPTFSADGRFVFGVPDPSTPTGVVDTMEGGQRVEVAAGALELEPATVEQAGWALSGFSGNTLVTQARGALERVFWTTDGRTRLGSAPAGTDFASFALVVDHTGEQYALHRSDGSVEISDLRSGSAIGAVPVAVDDVKLSYGYAGDGSRLVLALPEAVDPRYPKGLLTSIDLRPETWVALACRSVDRELTPDEWRRLTGAEPPSDLRCR